MTIFDLIVSLLAGAVLFSPVILFAVAVGISTTTARKDNNINAPFPAVVLAVALASILLTACDNKTETAVQRTRYTSELPFAKTNSVQSDWRITK